MPRASATPEQLRALLDYDAKTGDLTWRVNRGTRQFAGKRAGSVSANGGRVVCVCGKLERESRVVWAHVHGYWPEFQIDHINGDECDNRIENLRDVSGALNCQNKHRAPRTNKHGTLGASPVGNRWRAQIKVGGQKIYLGLFKTAEEANRVYVEAKRRLHPGCTL